jgi:hypothetical protein
MRRSPDTRFFSTRARRRWVLAQLPDPDTLERNLGTHLSAQEAFGEYESLNAQLNYRHAELRHSAEAGHVDVRGLRKLREGFRTLGADGDAARVPLIGGAEAAFTFAEAARGLWTIDMTRGTGAASWRRSRSGAPPTGCGRPGASQPTRSATGSGSRPSSLRRPGPFARPRPVANPPATPLFTRWLDPQPHPAAS